MMKILFFLNDGSMVGGASRSFLDMLPILSKKNDISIVAPFGDEIFKSICKKYISGKYIELNKLCKTAVPLRETTLLKNRIKKILYSFRVWFLLKKIESLIGKEYDLVWSNSLCVQLGCEFAKKHNIHHIWHVREFMEEDHGIDFYNHYYVYNKLFKSSSAIFITKKIAEKFSGFFGRNQIVLHNYVRYDFVEKKLTDDFVFTIVGGVSESKGQRYAVQAFSEVQKEYPNAKLWIVGEGTDREYCEQLVQKYGIKDKVEFFGQRNDVNMILAKSNIQLVCSRFEAMGRVTAEAMLSKTPVIGADTAGTKELIGDSYGLLYKEGNTDDLKDKMIYSIENYDTCIKIAEKAYQFALNEFSYERYKDNLNAFINKCIIN